MEEILVKEFNTLRNELAKEVRKHKLNTSFSLIGTPLKQSSILILGNNWGGNINTISQKQMPLANAILAYPSIPTYKGYINFFTVLFDGNMSKVIHFLNRSVYTNGNLIRTPNQNNEYKDLLKVGIQVSHKLLKQLVNLVMPKLIICFGNGGGCATESIFKTLGIQEDFWMMADNHHLKISNNCSTYKMNLKIDQNEYIIFSFPHSSRFNQWRKEIELDSNFIDLKKEIENLYCV